MTMFLEFVGPMRTLTKGRMKFEKGKIYRVDDDDIGMDMIETTRFKQVRDPTKKREAAPERRRGGVQINRTPRPEAREEQSERGDMSRADLTNLSENRKQEGEQGEKPLFEDAETDEIDTGSESSQSSEIREVREDGDEDNRPKLPATSFTSKGAIVKWAKDNLDLDLDKGRSLSELNRVLATEYGKRYAPPETGADEDDDTRDENTKVQAIVVA